MDNFVGTIDMIKIITNCKQGRERQYIKMYADKDKWPKNLQSEFPSNSPATFVGALYYHRSKDA